MTPARRGKLVRCGVLPLLILGVGCALRVAFFGGFVLCDDAQEFAAADFIAAHGPNLSDQFHLRFTGWLFNVLAFRALGVSEASYFLPTVLMSASFGVVGYGLLLGWGYPLVQAVAAGLVIAAAPFEVLLGTLRANDLILAWMGGLGLAAFFRLTRRPILQGCVLALLLWLGFYVKIWAVYALPALGLWFLRRALRDGSWRPGVSFAVASLVLHGATCLFWKARLGSYLPFLQVHAATYPVARADLPALFRTYPIMLFRGSDLGTTLFGSIPYLLVAGLVMKAVGTALGPKGQGYRLDAQDRALLAYYGSFFLILNFFPNSFAFDRYYSSPRIFRYLAPLSFPITLHVAKMILDVGRARLRSPVARWAPVALLGTLGGVCLVQTAEATYPTMTYRAKLMAAIGEVRAERPPKLVAEAWIGYFLANVYLKDIRTATQVLPPLLTYAARQHEEWLWRNQAHFARNTLLLSGLGSCVHYGAHADGFLLARFDAPLHPAWQVVRDLGPLEYLPMSEPVRLWRLSEKISDGTPPPEEVRGGSPSELYRAGLERFDANDCPGARRQFRAVLDRFPRSTVAADAAYFDAICHYRSSEWQETIEAFETLVRDYPHSMWVAGAYYHMGIAAAALGDRERARSLWERVVRDFPQERTLGSLAGDRLAEIGADRGVLQRLGGWLHLP